MESLTSVISTGVIVNIFYVVLSLLLIRIFLFFLDKSIDTGFQEWVENADHLSKSIYFAARFIGVCLVVGLLLG